MERADTGSNFFYETGRNEEKGEQRESTPQQVDKDNYSKALLSILREVAPEGNYSEEIVKKAVEELDKRIIKIYIDESDLRAREPNDPVNILTKEEWEKRKKDGTTHGWESKLILQPDLEKYRKLKQEWISIYSGGYWDQYPGEEGFEENNKRIKEIEEELSKLEL